MNTPVKISTKVLKHTPKKKLGGFADIASLLGSGIETVDSMTGKGTTDFGAALGGAGRGAAMGATLGLPGVIGGALIGGASSYLTNMFARKRADAEGLAETEIREKQKRNMLQMAQQDVNSRFNVNGMDTVGFYAAYGGKVKPDYDLDRAIELGYTPDEHGHMPSRDYKTGRILKSPNHPTFRKTIDGDKEMGYRGMMDSFGNVYTISPEDIPTEGYFAPSKKSMGGRIKPDYIAEGEEIVKHSGNRPVAYNGGLKNLSQDMVEVDGPRHESAQGGVAMKGGDKIYSDRIKLSKKIVKYFKKGI